MTAIVTNSTIITAAFLLLLLNSAYLAAFADASLFYFSNVLLHVVLGIAVTAAAFARRERIRPIVRIPLAAVAALGLVLVVSGTTRPYQPLLYAHIVSAVVASAALLAWITVRSLRRSAMVRPATRFVLLASVVTIVAGACGAAIAAARHETVRQARYRIVNPLDVPLRMEQEGAGPASPFFPSSANTNVNGIIPANFFLTSQMCGRCHRDIYDQWNSSAHHLSSFNNQWYRKSIEYMQDVVGTRPSRWCAGCHDHAVFFNGRFDRPIREQIETPEAQAGLACTSCHAITHVKSTMGQGDFVVEYPPLHDLATSDNPLLRRVHDWLLSLDPQPHRETFLKPFHREQSSEFCSACHKVHLDVPVNDYRWFRGFNDYDNWQASGVSGEGARSFYYPPAPQKCADCHMPRVASNDPAASDGFVRSHRFAAANTALPFVNGDAAQLKAVQDFLTDGQISVDVFGLVRTAAPAAVVQAVGTAREPSLASTFGVGEESLNFGAVPAIVRPPAEVIAPLDRADAAVRPGESVRIEVVVRTRKVGHFFPGGTVDAFDVWVELQAFDDTGRVLLESGSLERGTGAVDPGAHIYRSLLLDANGNPINKRNAWAARSVAYVRLIPPGAADTVHYRLDVPPDATGRIHVRAKVKYRKFAWWNTQWAFAGVRDPMQTSYALAHGHDDGRWIFTGDTRTVSGQMKSIPELPITVMAQSAAILRVSRDPGERAGMPVLEKAVRERWNDYGIGLLLQGDLKGAEAAFLKVTQMEPAYADGWVNVGRARLQEGNLAGAEDVLRHGLSVGPRLAKTHFFLGSVLKDQGRYDEALGHLRIAGRLYPRDRVVANQIGRVLFLQRKFREAIQEFMRVLAIDPEDLQAHYNLMLCYQGLGEASLAERERTLYLRFKADEASQAITGPYRQLHPHDNNERQPIHEHRSTSTRTEE
jgi:Flp pilus assembly protein TadD